MDYNNMKGDLGMNIFLKKLNKYIDTSKILKNGP